MDCIGVANSDEIKSRSGVCLIEFRKFNYNNKICIIPSKSVYLLRYHIDIIINFLLKLITILAIN